MFAVNVRFPKEFVFYVRRQAKQRGVAQSQVWRELVAIGMHNKEMNDGVLASVLNLTIQHLCLTRRMAGQVDNSLVDIAKEDARRAIEELQAS